MTPRPKLLAALAVAVIGLGAWQALPAGAHVPALFNSEIEETTVSSRLDGFLQSEYHHVLELLSLPLTCPSVTFAGKFKTKSVTELPLVVNFGNLCTYNGAGAQVEAKGCNFVFKANGELTIGSLEGKSCTKEPIEVLAEECTMKIGPQTIKSALTFTNITVGGVKEITVQDKAKGIEYSAAGTKCAGTGIFVNGNFTTAPTILRGANSKGALTNLTWAATVP